MRDDFTQDTKNILGNRAGWRCSNPDCEKPTRGAAEDENNYINIGVAAHICAASEGGPRYDTNMTQAERKSIRNGIWLCQSCSKLIDSDTNKYTVEKLHEWKAVSEERGKVALERQSDSAKQMRMLTIKSFEQANKDAKNEGILIDLASYFDGRFLKDEYRWGEIADKIKIEMRDHLNKESQYQVQLITHYSIAFIAGRIMNPKSGIKTIPVQNTINGSEIWEIENPGNKEYEEISFRKERLNDTDNDIAMVISITKNIGGKAKEYIQKERLPIGEIYYCGFEMPSIDSIANGEHAWRVLKQINYWIEERPMNYKEGMLHIFVAAPISIMFHLGKMSLSYGKGKIYDHDYDIKRSGTYFPTLSFFEGDWI